MHAVMSSHTSESKPRALPARNASVRVALNVAGELSALTRDADHCASLSGCLHIEGATVRCTEMNSNPRERAPVTTRSKLTAPPASNSAASLLCSLRQRETKPQQPRWAMATARRTDDESTSGRARKQTESANEMPSPSTGEIAGQATKVRLFGHVRSGYSTVRACGMPTS
jgi:hypothetical protein